MAPQKAHGETCLFCVKRKAGWFCSFSPQVLVEFEAIGTTLLLPTGSILFTEGHSPRNVSVICAGRIKLTRTSRDGKTLLVKIAKGGDVLGVSAALQNLPYEVTAQVIEPVQVRSFQTKDFLHFIKRHSEGSIHVAESLSKSYISALNEASRLALSPTVVTRVAHLLLELAAEEGGGSYHRPEIHIALKHEELAAMLGTSRESITRALSELKRQKMIEIRGTKIVLLKRTDLEQLV